MGGERICALADLLVKLVRLDLTGGVWKLFLTFEVINCHCVHIVLNHCVFIDIGNPHSFPFLVSYCMKGLTSRNVAVESLTWLVHPYKIG